MTERDQRILRLAVAPFKGPTARERRAREGFDLSWVRFWQEVNRILDMPASHAWDPHMAARLKEQRVQRRRPALAGRLL